MAKIIVKSKENPKLQQNTLSDGRISLYLEYYLGRLQWTDEDTGQIKVKHDRKKETLNLYLVANPHTPSERLKNKEVLELATEIRAEREQRLKADKTGKRLKANITKINFLDFAKAYIDNYTKKDIRMVEGAINRFSAFLIDEHPLFKSTLKPDQLTKTMVTKFAEYLESRSTGEGARGYFQRFKKLIKYAVEQDVIAKNPCMGVVCKVDEQTLRKDVLSLNEIEKRDCCLNIV